MADNRSRVTKIGQHIILTDDGAFVTRAGAYAEILGEDERVSSAGMIAETLGQDLQVTSAGAIVEMLYSPEGNIVALHKASSVGGRASHKLLPSEVTGYALDPSWSFWSIIVPEETENLILNPSFEGTNFASGDHIVDPEWASTSLVSGEYPFATRGVKFFKMTPDPSKFDARLYYPQDVVSGTIYTLSMDLFLRHTHNEKVRLQILNGIIFSDIIVQKIIKVTQEGWQRVHFTWTARITEEVRIQVYVNTLGIDGSQYICTDGWQLEEKAYPTTYCDGSIMAPNDSAGRRSFFWTGVPKLSSSHRTIDAEGHGRVINLSEELLFYTTSIIGLGMPPPNLLTKQVGTQGVEIYQGAYDQSRDFTIVGVTFGCDFESLMRSRNNLIELLRNNKNNSRTQLKIRWQPTDSNGTPWGNPLEIRCAYTEGLGGQITNLYQESLPLQFHASHPYFEEMFEMSADLSLPVPWDDKDLWYRDETGSWQYLTGSDSPLGITNGEIYGVIFDKYDRPVVVGDFTDNGYNTGTNRASYWDGTDWIQYGFTAPDAAVRVVHKRKTSKQLIIGGDFTNLGGNHVAVFREVLTPDWDNTVGILSATPLTIESDEKDNVFYGGNFAGKIAVWNGSSTQTLGTGLDAQVETIRISKDGYLYIGGQFTQDGLANPMYGICRWDLNNGTAWSTIFENIGESGWAVHAMDIGPDGNLYALIETSFGVSMVLKRWDGNTWVDIVDVSYSIGVTQATIEFDDKGMAYLGGAYFAISGDFNQANRFYRNTMYPLDIYAYDHPSVFWIKPKSYAFGLKNKALANTTVYGATSESMTGGRTTVVDYQGTANVFPTICIYGELQMIGIINHTTGGEVWFRNNLNDILHVAHQEEVYIYLDGGRLRAWSTHRGNMSAFVNVNASNLGNFYMRPGDNNIAVYTKDNVLAGKVFLKWNNQFYSMDSSVQ